MNQVTEELPELPTSANGEVRVSVRGLWKVFGPADGPDVGETLEGKTKDEVQDELDSVLALHDVSFDVHQGETFVVMGLSGSGKSTLVRCLIRLIEPTVGEVIIDGEDILSYTDEELTQARRQKTGMVFQYFGLLPHRTVIDNVAWGLEVQGVPREDRLVQSTKSGSRASEADVLLSIAAALAEDAARGGLYILGPGTTTKAITDALGLDGTLLGVDAIDDGALVGTDLGEREILELVRRGPAKVVVSVIGGQGYVLGRGNQQLSAEVVRTVGPENIVVVTSKEKLATLRGRPLLVDTGDPALDEELTGYVRVTTGYNEQAMYRIGR